MANADKSFSTDLATKEKVEAKKPKLYKVILLNDDYTPMEYVVRLLKIVFKKSESEAVNIMLMVHKKVQEFAESLLKRLQKQKLKLF